MIARPKRSQIEWKTTEIGAWQNRNLLTLFLPRPRPFFEARLAALGVGAAELEGTLPALDVPLLVVAGDVDRLVGSAEEAPRIASVVENTKVHVVRGAGHSGTLDQRCDLRAVMADWRLGCGCYK